MSEWQEATIGEVADFVQGLALNAKTNHLLVKTGGLPLLRIKDLLENKVEFFVDETNVPKKCIALEHDLILTRTGQVGFVFMGKKGVLHNNCFRIVPKSDRIFLPFIYWFFNRKSSREYLTNIAAGSVQPDLTHKIFSEVEIPLPPIEEQKAIASVLSSLDDKIELLHRQNAALERMAETLFRQWFVEEAQGDWEERPLSSIANFLNGLACQKFPPTDVINILPVLKIKELSSGISENSDWASSNVKPEYIVENGDVIFAWSASLMVKIWDGEKCVLNQHLFKVTSHEFPKWFYLHWCKYHLDEFISISSSHATTMGHIKRGDLDAAMVKVPKPQELELMTDHMTPLLEKQITNTKQIKTLEKLRDNLLPKLMSGEVRVNLAGASA